MSKRAPVAVRPVKPEDWDTWKVLWDEYNEFYGRAGTAALPDEVTQTTWRRFFDAHEPLHCVVAERDGKILGICHFLYHRSTSRLEQKCYLQDLYTAPDERGHGIGRALIEGAGKIAFAAGARQMYWLTHSSNTPARTLYDSLAKNQGFIQYVQDLTE